MRVACVFISHFRIAVERQREPRLDGRPVVIGETSDGRSTVLECSPEAEAEGVRAGIPLRQAWGLARDAAFLPPDPVLYADVFEAVLQALETISPTVEPGAPGVAWLDVGGLFRHYPDDAALAEAVSVGVRAASGLLPSTGVGGGKFVAWAAAVTSAPGEVCVVPPGREATFLAPLSLDLLPCSPEVHRRLRLFGLETMADLAALPRGPLAAQFGPEGERLWRLASGHDDEPLRPRHREPVLSERISLPSPTAGREGLVIAARQLVGRLFRRPELRGRTARRLRLRFALVGGRSWEKTIVFKEATADRDQAVFVLKSALDAAAVPGAVEEVTLELSGLAQEAGKQAGLWAAARGSRQVRLREAVQQLKARFGQSPVQRVVEVEPWSRIPERRQALIDYDP